LKIFLRAKNVDEKINEVMKKKYSHARLLRKLDYNIQNTLNGSEVTELLNFLNSLGVLNTKSEVGNLKKLIWLFTLVSSHIRGWEGAGF